MALDGAFLRHIKQELEGSLLGARVDKIHQPNREELVVAFRTREAAYRVLFSARANSARVHFTTIPLENPKQPPMLCMLLRKKLLGAKLVAIRQPELERLLHFDFDAINELGDHVTLTLTMEVMGRYSNIIFTGEDGKIIDALKRVDAEMSSQRLVLPGLSYQLPPPQDKLCPLSATSQQVVGALQALPPGHGALQGLPGGAPGRFAHRLPGAGPPGGPGPGAHRENHGRGAVFPGWLFLPAAQGHHPGCLRQALRGRQPPRASPWTSPLWRYTSTAPPPW